MIQPCKVDDQETVMSMLDVLNFVLLFFLDYWRRFWVCLLKGFAS